MRLFGRGHQLLAPIAQDSDHPPLTDLSQPYLDSEATDTATHWKVNSVGLKAGWYMLEVEHSVASIGCTLTLKTDSGDPEYLLLTSKPVCKRIVRFDVRVRHYTLSIDQPGCVIRRIELVRLAKSFAMNRMSKRLKNRGGTDCVSEIDPANLYDAYKTQIVNLTSAGKYVPQPWVDDPQVDCSDAAFRARQSLLLLLHRSLDDEQDEVDDSVQSAIAFARQAGWKVEWCEERGLNSISLNSGMRVFRLLVPGFAQFRKDSFHHMMAGIDDETVLIYADHDHADEQGQCFDPVLKPAWNPELLINTNYIQLPWMISDTWVRQLTGYQLATSIDFDRWLLAAALGVSNEVPAVYREHSDDDLLTVAGASPYVAPLLDQQVKRLPLVLARDCIQVRKGHEELSSRADKWRQNVETALILSGHSAVVTQGMQKGCCRVSWTLSATEPMVDIIIPSRDKMEILKACIDSVFNRTSYSNYRVVVVDNDSEERKTEDYYSELRKNPRFKLLRFAGQFNYSAINNYAVANTDAPIIVLLNNDTEVISPGWLSELVSQAMRKNIGCVGAKLYYSNGRIQHAGVIVGITGVAGHAHRYVRGDARGYCDRLLATQNMTAVTAACLAIRRSTFLNAGGLDQNQLGVAWNDVDLCLKVRKLGYRNIWTPYAELFHHEGLSRGADNSRLKIQRVDSERRVMIERWNLDCFDDPAYHPLLTRDSESFSLGSALT